MRLRTVRSDRGDRRPRHSLLTKAAKLLSPFEGSAPLHAPHVALATLCLLFAAGPARASDVDPSDGEPRPRIGLVLGGGGARGFAHIGVIEALEEAGVRPDVAVAPAWGRW